MLPLNKIVEYSIAFITLYLTVFFVVLYLKHRRDVTDHLPVDKQFTPTISVIIPAFNEAETLTLCVTSVITADYPKDKIEVIIVDDGSKDATFVLAQSLAKQYHNVHVYTKKNEGKATALNYGIAKAKNEIIATLDGDSFITKDTIWKMLPFFKDPEVAAVTPAIKVFEPPASQKQNVLEIIQKVEYLFTLFSRRVLTYVDAVTVTPGPFSMFRAWIFDKVGGFDPHCVLEDQEIALRIQQANYKIRSSLDAVVYTEIPKTFGELLKQRIRWHRGGLRNSIKYLNMISPKYGDFGIIIMPLTFIALIALFLVFSVSIFNYTTQPSYFGTLGIDSIFLNISAIHIIGLFIFALNAIWIVWGMAHFKSEGVPAWQLLLYIVSYSYLLTIYWAAAIIKEIKMEKLSW